MIYLPKNRREWSLALMMIFYLVAGFNHFRMPAFYLPLVPDYLPAGAFLNAAAGVAEIALAILLAWTKTRRAASMGIIVLLLLFLPSHIWFIQNDGCVDPHGLCVPVWVAWVRLIIIHPLLLGWAWMHCKRP